MDYKELYNKAKSDLENVKLQEARIQSQIDALIQELGVPVKEGDNLKEVLEKYSDSLKAKQKSVISELEAVLKEYNELVNVQG